MRIARLDGQTVINIEVADQEWVDAQPDPTIFVTINDDDCVYIGGDYVDGHFYEPQPFPSWTRNNGSWIPPVPKPADKEPREIGDMPWVWNEEKLNWEKLEVNETI